MDLEKLRLESLNRTRAERLLDRYLVNSVPIMPAVKRVKVDEVTQQRVVQMTSQQGLARVLKYVSDPHKTKKCLSAASKLIVAHSDCLSFDDLSQLVDRVLQIPWSYALAKDLNGVMEAISSRSDACDMHGFNEAKIFASAMAGLSTDDNPAFHKQVQALHQILIDFPAAPEERSLAKQLFVGMLKAAILCPDWKKPGIRSLATAAYKTKAKFSPDCVDGLADVLQKASERCDTQPEAQDPTKPTHSISDGRVEVLSTNGLDAWSLRQQGLGHKKS